MSFQTTDFQEKIMLDGSTDVHIGHMTFLAGKFLMPDIYVQPCIIFQYEQRK